MWLVLDSNTCSNIKGLSLCTCVQVLGADAVALEAGIVRHIANFPSSSSGTSSTEQSTFTVPGQVSEKERKK